MIFYLLPGTIAAYLYALNVALNAAWDGEAVVDGDGDDDGDGDVFCTFFSV